MDWSAISGITTSIAAARDIAKGMSALRDSTLINERTAALMDQLLKAQEGLLAHNTALLQLQQDHFVACEKLRKLEEAVNERGRYSTFEITPGSFVYRVNVAPQQTGTREPSAAEPMHYVCQPCYDNGRKVILGYLVTGDAFSHWKCSACEREIYG